MGGGRFGQDGGLTCEHTVVQMSGSLAYTVGFERGMAEVDGRAPVPMTIRVTPSTSTAAASGG